MSREPVRSTTIVDVARQAGVSYQTVSRVVNHHPSVKPETRSKVLAAIQALDYQPNSLARSLASRRSTALGLISFGTTFYGPAQMVANLEQTARAKGYTLSLASINSLRSEELSQAVQTLLRQRVDGLMVIAPLQQVESARLEQLCPGTPLVLIDAEPTAQIPFTSIDQYSGARQAAQHLLQLGHQQIAFIGGPTNWHDALQRQRGWLSALREARLEPVAQLEGDWGADSGYQAVQNLLVKSSAFTALLVANDQMALGALLALSEAGLQVPQQVSLVGFDNIPESAFFQPPLTTIDQDFVTLAQRSLEQLLALIEMPELAPKMQLIPAQLLVRRSTAECQISNAPR